LGLPLESVPNFSEGRDRATIQAIGGALARSGRVLDVHVDRDHNRSVFTVVGDDDALVDGLVAAVAVARDRIDLRTHEGVHPRVGAADVVPVVPIRPADMARARDAALAVAGRIGSELDLPVFLYGEVGGGRGPAFFRRGGPAELARRVESGELSPEFGPPRLDPGAGAVLVGARRPLIALNVTLAGASVETAREIAAVVREAGGGFAGVRALGLALPEAGRVQVSMNVEDYEASPLHEVVARVGREAAARGAEVLGSEVVGLLPADAAIAAAAAPLGLAALDRSRVLELALSADA
jgi:glutamate formiminotransferase